VVPKLSDIRSLIAIGYVKALTEPRKMSFGEVTGRFSGERQKCAKKYRTKTG
jgi:hypothetical protein